MHGEQITIVDPVHNASIVHDDSEAGIGSGVLDSECDRGMSLVVVSRGDLAGLSGGQHTVSAVGVVLWITRNKPKYKKRK